VPRVEELNGADGREVLATPGRAVTDAGYALTCHVAQGMTVERSFVLADAGLCREWGYTALTRGA